MVEEDPGSWRSDVDEDEGGGGVPRSKCLEWNSEDGVREVPKEQDVSVQGQGYRLEMQE